MLRNWEQLLSCLQKASLKTQEGLDALNEASVPLDGLREHPKVRAFWEGAQVLWVLASAVLGQLTSVVGELGNTDNLDMDF